MSLKYQKKGKQGEISQLVTDEAAKKVKSGIFVGKIVREFEIARVISGRYISKRSQEKENIHSYQEFFLQIFTVYENC